MKSSAVNTIILFGNVYYSGLNSWPSPHYKSK